MMVRRTPVGERPQVGPQQAIAAETLDLVRAEVFWSVSL